MPAEAVKKDYSTLKDAFKVWVEQNLKAETQPGDTKEEGPLAPAAAWPRTDTEDRTDAEVMSVTDVRNLVGTWVEEGQYLVRLVPALVDELARTGAEIKAIRQECETLRQEKAELDALLQESARLREEIGDLQRQRDEIVAAFSKLAQEMLQPMSDMVKKVRAARGRSPFDGGSQTG